MVWNNVYLSTPNPVGNFQGSAATTVLSGLSLTAALQGEIASASAISGGEATFAGGNFSSTITVTDGDFLSVDSQTNSSGMTTGQLRLVFAASGVSLMYSSGESEYEVGSARSADQT